MTHFKRLVVNEGESKCPLVLVSREAIESKGQVIVGNLSIDQETGNLPVAPAGILGLGVEQAAIVGGNVQDGIALVQGFEQPSKIVVKGGVLVWVGLADLL